ncbi:MAG: hypothetical protein J6V72_06165 [Kiritimatiellae bacterium]|nr:hypothetical protein [Kiritimatiellia bacterium]
MSKYQVKSVTATFGSSTFKVVQAPSAQPQSSDPTDVTCLDDTAKQFIKGALLNNDTFDLVVQGITEAPTVNTVGALTLSVIYCDGSADTTKSVAIGNCIVQNVQPPNPEAGGDRAANWTLTFQPGAVTVSGTGNT